MQSSIKTWKVKFGSSVAIFYTLYHAEQFARALRLNRTQFTVTVPRVAALE